MKCPLILRSKYTTFEHIETVVDECITTECAWFDSHTGVCSVLALARIMTAGGNVLGRIHNVIKELPPK